MPNSLQRSTEPSETTPGVTPTRRRVLGLALGAGAGSAFLAACGGSSGGDSAAASPDASTPAASNSSSADPSPAGGKSLAAVADVPVGGGVVIASPQVVVTQPTAGEFKAFSSICTHLSCPVARVKAGLIESDCHGSRYSAADGSVKNGPATRPLKEIPVKVDGDQIVQA